MFTDLVGFTALTQADEASALARLREEEAILRPIFPAFGGREIKSTGDGALVEFGSALKATQCAIEIQDRLRRRNLLVPDRPIDLRVGLHVGDVEDSAGDIFGDAVNVAARIVSLAKAGEICLSAQVADHLRGKLAHELVRLGPQQLKGVATPVEVFRLAAAPSTAPAAPADSGLPRLAVLPLANISPDPADEYFADGLTEELISVLSQIRGLRVIARTSVAQYKSTQKSVAQIGGELGVQSILEGSVRKAGPKIRITLQLIDVARQEHTWSESYNRELDDVFTIQSEIAERTASVLRLELGRPTEMVADRTGTRSIAAYEQYLKGLHYWQSSLDRERRAVVDSLEAALRIDPNFSLAMATLANALLAFSGETLSGRETFPRVRTLVDQALGLNPNLPEAHAASGSLAMHADQDWPRAEAELTRAIDLNPSSSVAHGWRGILYETLQRFDAAVAEYRTAIQLDPRWPIIRVRVATALRKAGRFDESIAEAEAAMRELPDVRGIDRLVARALWAQGHWAAAEEAARKGLEQEGVDIAREAGVSFDIAMSRLAWAGYRARRGDPDPAKRILASMTEAARTQYIPASTRARMHAVVGDHTRALDLLEEDRFTGFGSLWFYYQDEDFDALREEPRFQAMLRALHLPLTLGYDHPTHPVAGDPPLRPIG
jgi:adenylate cyclase